MAIPVSSMVEGKVRIHRWRNFVIVHWILCLGQAELDQLLRDDSLAKFSSLPALPFSQPGF
jgi:hypothetical protein